MSNSNQKPSWFGRLSALNKKNFEHVPDYSVDAVFYSCFGFSGGKTQHCATLLACENDYNIRPTLELILKEYKALKRMFT